MISFDAAHAAVHYPPDRRFRIWIRPSILIAAAVLVRCLCLRRGSRFFLSGSLIFRLSRRYIPTTSPVLMAFRCGCVTATSSTSFLSRC